MIAIGNDHAAPQLKMAVAKFLESEGVQYLDFGVAEGEKCDYPDKAKEVCDAVVSGRCEKAILMCGTGVGMSMAANKIKGIRAACCSDTFSAKFTRLHNDANVLCIGQRVVGDGLAAEIVKVFLETPFEGGRHAVRVDKIMKLEG